MVYHALALVVLVLGFILSQKIADSTVRLCVQVGLGIVFLVLLLSAISGHIMLGSID